MESVTGVFQSRTAAEEGVAELLPLGIPKDRITILTPQATKKNSPPFRPSKPNSQEWERPWEPLLEELWVLPAEWARRER